MIVHLVLLSGVPFLSEAFVTLGNASHRPSPSFRNVETKRSRSLLTRKAALEGLLGTLDEIPSNTLAQIPVAEFSTFSEQCFTISNCAVTPFWILMIFFPNKEITKRMMQSMWPVLLCALPQAAMILNGFAQPGSLERAKFFFTEAVVKLSAMQTMRELPEVVSEEWAHVLDWDLLAGRLVYLDGLTREVFMAHSLLATFAFGPTGLLIHWLTCLLTGKDNRSLHGDGSPVTDFKGVPTQDLWIDLQPGDLTRDRSSSGPSSGL
uniref:Uncharacterized protein n=1 Tax=Chromera velia CCMP2878 TaxID=1169474 RepID=A0A0G4H0Z3_9ALVE|mmetsp:Transcript_18397/g.37230  ORF Transcript_18397/g.37230 Transcript_18397/m.37230 type:complete len:264 (+) Transcript_18397:221-1012(+)|eukprot:Cvel_24215.t1-p1 / transcript=Cvel_24215.t1 / gene=Cvel_24215 / organism=Chromera_velia_CCMP2878 / gene_product=hypothetical protein / transcript_product=hypothetical protein / location=Cvel_scaffold2588:19459-21453(-) / protein_length=263 / sequence_SO=supercontig / SO=protein_coding / is_pseudo=false